MDEETKKLLLENAEIARKTLEIMQKMERRLFWQRALKAVRWVVIIVLFGLGVWQIRPYIDSILSLYQNLFGVFQQAQNSQQDIPTELQKLLGQ